MAIMVTDPRNNLLSQLTAVGQQYLAGKQQERMSATEFANKKALIELMDRLGGAADIREFEQGKELAKLESDLTAGRLDKDGAIRLAELRETNASLERRAQIGATGAERTALAGRQPAQQPTDYIGIVGALTNLFGIPTGDALKPGVPPQPELPQFTSPLRQTAIDMGGITALNNIEAALNDPVKLTNLRKEIEGNPIGVALTTLRLPGSPRNQGLIDFLDERADLLQNPQKFTYSQQQTQLDKNRADLMGIFNMALQLGQLGSK